MALFALSLGFLGVITCVAGIAAVWSVGSRLSRANEKVFDAVDKSLAAVRDRVLKTQRRVQELKITSEDIREGLKDWTRKAASERLASRLEVGVKAEQLVLGLQQADLWLEMSGASIQGVQQALEMGSSMGAPIDPALVDPLLEKLAGLRSQLKQATETVDGIRMRAAEMADGAPLEERIDQVVKLALRVAATLGEIDARLGESANKLSEVQAKGLHLKSKTHTYIAIAEIGAVLLIAWMAAGQAVLCLHGWKVYGRNRAAVY
jgi:DNA-binding transcriptional MerR regulator